MEISEESVVKAADAIQVWINPALSIAQDIALRRNLKLFLKVGSYFYSSSISFLFLFYKVNSLLFWIQLANSIN